MATPAPASLSSRRRRRGGATSSASPVVVAEPVRRDGVELSEVQRSRMLRSAVQVVSELGYGKMSVSRVTGRARVSRRTFYDFFEDREDCFLTIFDDAFARIAALTVSAYEDAADGDWCGRVRAALGALLVFLDERPEMGSLLVVDALRAGPRVLERRAEILAQVGAALDEGGSRAARGTKSAKGANGGLPPLAGEGVIGAVFSVIHTRLLAGDRAEPLPGLLGPLMGMIVLPYLGPVAARREIGRASSPKAGRVTKARRGLSTRSSSSSSSSSSFVGDPLAGLPMRLTYRTLRVLSAVGDRPGASNRGVSDVAGVSDQGQISKLLARLERLGLVENALTMARDGRSGGRRGVGHLSSGEPNAWRLTTHGEEVHRAIIGSSSSSSWGTESRMGEERRGSAG